MKLTNFERYLRDGALLIGVAGAAFKAALTYTPDGNSFNVAFVILPLTFLYVTCFGIIHCALNHGSLWNPHLFTNRELLPIGRFVRDDAIRLLRRLKKAGAEWREIAMLIEEYLDQRLPEVERIHYPLAVALQKHGHYEDSGVQNDGEKLIDALEVEIKKFGQLVNHTRKSLDEQIMGDAITLAKSQKEVSEVGARQLPAVIGERMQQLRVARLEVENLRQ